MQLLSSKTPASSFSSVILLVSLVSLRIEIAQAVINLPNKNVNHFPGLIAFGDSIVDPGNNNDLSTTIKCDFAPYGRDFMGGKPSGRFSNGKIITDLLDTPVEEFKNHVVGRVAQNVIAATVISGLLNFSLPDSPAEKLGIKELLPAYLDPNLQPDDLLTGVSFASGGAGYDPLTAQLVKVLGLSDQLNLFRECIRKVKAICGEERSASIISESLYIVVAGSDDIANTYFSSTLRRFTIDVPAYTDLMIQAASDFLQELWSLGARRIGVFNAPPIGCVPSQRTQGGGEQRQCAEERNAAAMLFNSKLSSLLDSFNKKDPHLRAVYIDIYTPLLDLINNHRSYGFEEETLGCCGTGEFEVTLLCNKLSPGTCQNVSKYLFWDAYHPSQRAYIVLVNPMLQKYVKKFF